MDGEYGPEIFLGAFLLPFSQPVKSLVLAVGLDHAKLQVTGHNRIDVKDRSAGGFHCTAEPVDLSFLVDDSGNGAAGGIIHSGDTAGSNGDEGGLGHNWSWAHHEAKRQTNGCD